MDFSSWCSDDRAVLIWQRGIQNKLKAPPGYWLCCKGQPKHQSGATFECLTHAIVNCALRRVLMPAGNLAGCQMPWAFSRDSGPCFPLISAFGCLGPRDPQHTLQHRGLRFCTMPVQSWETRPCLHPAFKKCLWSFPDSLPKSPCKHYLWRLSWAEWTVQSHTWDVLSSFIKTMFHTHIW